MKRLLAFAMAIVLLCAIGVGISSAEEEQFILPEDLQIIKTEAFVGTDATYVRIPEGVTQIQERAFADSAIVEIDLPASITYIAENAFSGLTDLTVTVPAGSYAEEYCIENQIKHEVVQEETEIETPEGYPQVIPGIDFDGQTIYIYDYWTASSERVDNPTKKQQATYDYHDWLEKTYDCKIVQISKGNWGSNITELKNFVNNFDGTLCLYILPPDFVAEAWSGDAIAPWNTSLINLSSGKWNGSTVRFMTKGGKVYGASTGKSEPRQCLFFNKRILMEAGIDWNTIYDMQAAGSWTWSAFEDLLKKVHRDTDGDGAIDVFGMTGSNTDFYLMGVVSNGGDFFTFNNAGDLEVAINSDRAISGLQWAKDTWKTYSYKQSEDDNWDYFKRVWNEGLCGFYMYQAYGGFNENSEMSGMSDEWGCVAFPVGPYGSTYLNLVSDDVTVIPNVYDQDTAAKIAFIYDMWTNETPGYEDKNSWIGNKYSFTDARAVTETYGMLREPEHGIVNSCLYLGSLNDILGPYLLWQIDYESPANLITAATPEWQALCDAFNGK